jgi:hypothetical protein
MRQFFNKFTPLAKIMLFVTTGLAFGLLVFGAITPPPGEIHNSILKGVAEMLAFGALWIIAHALFEEKKDVHFKHGDTEVNITDEEEEQ